MSSYTQLLYHIVFSTKRREKVLIEANREKLFHFVWGILNNKKCLLYQVNGIEDHIHIATHLHPSISLAGLVRDIKVASSLWIKGNNIFPNFSSWQEGYGGFTYSIKEKDRLVTYIKEQKEHHQIKTFKEEFIELLNEHEIDFDERYLI